MNPLEEIASAVLALPLVKSFLTALEIRLAAAVTRGVITVLTRRDSDPAFKAKWEAANAEFDSATTDEGRTLALQKQHALSSGQPQ